MNRTEQTNLDKEPAPVLVQQSSLELNVMEAPSASEAPAGSEAPSDGAASGVEAPLATTSASRSEASSASTSASEADASSAIVAAVGGAPSAMAALQDEPSEIDTSAKTTPKNHQLTEILIQYGHLQSDLGELSLITNRSPGKQQEMGMFSFVMIFLPFLLLQVVYAFAMLWFPSWAIESSRGFSYHPDAESFHALVFVTGVPIVLSFFLGYTLYRLNALGPSLPGMPTHLGLSLAGVKLHRRTVSFSWATGWKRWKDLTGISIKEKGKRKTKVIVLNFRGIKTVKIDVSMIRRPQEKEVLANAIKALAPEHLQTEGLLQLVDKTLPRTARYTEIWTQALLNKPERQLLTALEPGTTLHDGLYEVKSQLGSGAQGTAYLVEQQVPAAPQVVLKEYVLPDHNNMHDRRRALKRLEDEVQILSRLDHKQIVHLYDVFVEDHRAYLVLDLIDGPSLKQLLQSGRIFSEMEVIDLAIQMCTILNYLHSLSPPLVHQDFTPDNMLLTAAKVLKLVDFNVAKESAGTKTNLVVGKQCYMPPEQFKGKASVESDIYALGATLFYLLTGQEPEPLTCSRPRELNEQISPALDQIVARATALEFESRYGHASELQADLERLKNQTEDGDHINTAVHEAGAAS